MAAPLQSGRLHDRFEQLGRTIGRAEFPAVPQILAARARRAARSAPGCDMPDMPSLPALDAVFEERARNATLIIEMIFHNMIDPSFPSM
jgi:hypothetical protein